MNLVLGMVLLGASGSAVWYGITNPAGGYWSSMSNLLRGTGNTKAGPSATSSAFLASLAPLAGSGSSSSTSSAAAPAAGGMGETAGAGAPLRQRVLSIAHGWLGVPYVWGGESRAGVDCSGLVQLVYRQAGINLPRTSELQQTVGKSVPLAHAQPGDLIFFSTPAVHVGIYVGGNQILNAAHTGTVVRVEPIWYTEGTVTARDVLSSHTGGRPVQLGHVPPRTAAA